MDMKINSDAKQCGAKSLANTLLAGQLAKQTPVDVQSI